jgi:hypothetical protein
MTQGERYRRRGSVSHLVYIAQTSLHGNTQTVGDSFQDSLVRLMTYQQVDRRDWPIRQFENPSCRCDHGLYGLSVDRLSVHDEISIRFVTASIAVWLPRSPGRNHDQVGSAAVTAEHKGSERTQVMHLSSPQHHGTRTVAENRPGGTVTRIQDGGERIGSYHKHPVCYTGGDQPGSGGKRIYETRANRTHVESRGRRQA